MSSDSPVSLGVVLPFYNEETFLHATLNSLQQQSRRPEQVILVDNGSTDSSAEIAHAFCESFGPGAKVLEVETAGKVHALHAACPRIKTDWLVHCDADTVYPPHYLATAARMVRNHQGEEPLVGLFAIGVPEEQSARQAVIEDRLSLAKKYPKKCFTGGFGQIFRTSTLLEAGGYDAKIWPYVLMDHEVVHRVFQHGGGAYEADFWCCPSERRSDRTAVRWNFTERWMYRNLPRRLEAWFFYRFLASRFEKRGLKHLNLRKKSW